MLTVENLHKTFNPGTPDEVRALRGLSLRLEAGDFTVVIGSNGSGKSSLLNLVAGSLVADAGRMVLDGVDVTAWPEHRRARWIGRVFQNPFSGTAPRMSIAENLALAAGRGRRRGLNWLLGRRLMRELRERIRELNVGLEDRLGTEIGALSGGQRQALTLLMATWVKPKLLLLDEHTAALDPRTADQVIGLTRDLVTRERITTLMVTHSMHQAVNLGGQLIMLHRGRKVHDIGGAAKKRLRVEDLLGRFDEIRRAEQLDPGAAELLGRRYV